MDLGAVTVTDDVIGGSVENETSNTTNNIEVAIATLDGTYDTAPRHQDIAQGNGWPD